MSRCVALSSDWPGRSRLSSRPRLISRIALAIGDGAQIDWDDAGRRLATTPEASVLDRLRLIEERIHETDLAPLRSHSLALPSRRVSRPLKAVLWIAVPQVVLSSIIFLLWPRPERPLPLAFVLVTALAFALSAVAIAVGARLDPRAHPLAGFFAGIASAAAQPFLAYPDLPPSLSVISRTLSAFLVECFLPFFLWSFLRDFPHTLRLGRGSAAIERLVRLTALVGVVLFTANALHRLGLLDWVAAGLLTPLFRDKWSPYWMFLFAATLAAPAVAYWRARAARPDEQRRVTLFLIGLASGILPLLLLVLAEAVIPSFGRLMDMPRNRMLGSFVIYGFLITVPLLTTYSVAAHRILDFRVVIHRAARFALTRWTLAVLSAAPIGLLAALAWTHRTRPLDELLARPTAVALLIGAAIGVLLLAVRQPLLSWLENRILHRLADPSAILGSFSAAAARARDLDELIECIECHGRDLSGGKTLLWSRDVSGSRFAPQTAPGRPLPEQSLLAHLLREVPEPLSVDPDALDSVFPLLPETERDWVTDQDLRLLVPVTTSGGECLAFLALGVTYSGLPLARRDLQSLSALASTASIAWAHRAFGPSGQVEAHAPLLSDLAAGECRGCLEIGRLAGEPCPSCGRPLSSAAIPYLLAGKFRLEAILGKGGMGVVYRATDEVLSRPVALKTLPRLASDPLLRLRREARAMAALTHPRLALIYGAETWRGVPVLVVEYLAGGTLAQRLTTATGPVSLPPVDALRLVSELAEGLMAMHQAGLLHRDLKPSNIGFTADGQPKLLDFGLARLAEEAGLTASPYPADLPLASPETPLGLTRTGQVIGTPLYLSPETLAGTEPAAAQDLWSLHMILWEAIAGRHPFADRPARRALRALAHGRIPDIRASVPSCPPPIAALLSRGFEPEPGKRLPSATALRDELLSVLAGFA